MQNREDCGSIPARDRARQKAKKNSADNHEVRPRKFNLQLLTSGQGGWQAASIGMPTVPTAPTITPATTLRAAADAYIAWLEFQVSIERRSPATLKVRRSHMEMLGGAAMDGETSPFRSFVNASGCAIADIAVGELRRSQIVHWLDAVTRIPNLHDGKFCPTRDHSTLKSLQALLTWCADRDACARGLASKIHTNYEPPPSRALHRTELECFRAVLRARRQRSDIQALRVIADNGTRPCEVRLARAEHFDSSTGILRWPQGKTRKPRIIVLSQSSLMILRGRVRHAGGGYLFPSHERPTRPYTIQHLNRLVKEIARDADIERPEELTLSDFRDTYATVAYEEGASLYDVSRALSHRSTTTTVTYYLHNAVDPGARRVNDIINPPRSKRGA